MPVAIEQTPKCMVLESDRHKFISLLKFIKCEFCIIFSSLSSVCCNSKCQNGRRIAPQSPCYSCASLISFLLLLWIFSHTKRGENLYVVSIQYKINLNSISKLISFAICVYEIFHVHMGNMCAVFFLLFTLFFVILFYFYLNSYFSNVFFISFHFSRLFVLCMSNRHCV